MLFLSIKFCFHTKDKLRVFESREIWESLRKFREIFFASQRVFSFLTLRVVRCAVISLATSGKMAEDFGNGGDMNLPVGKDAVNRLIQQNSHIFSDSHCKVCSAVLISESQKLAHYQSKKHANKYRRYTSIHQGEDFTPAKKMKADDTDTVQNASDNADRNKCCPVCNMTFSSPVVAMSHYIGKTHSKNLKMLEQGGVSQGVPRVPKPAAPRVIPENTDKSDPEKFCQLCSATFNNPHMAEQHYKGRRHLKQETKTKLMTVYSSSGKTLPKNAPLNPVTPGSGASESYAEPDFEKPIVFFLDD